MILERLSKTSPYVCDLNRGPIEPANRMASAPANKVSVVLEPKESFPKTRAPLKLLGLEEIPIDTTMATTDINASLQPVWYTEQTIVDDHPAQQEINMSHNQEKLTHSHATLPTIQSESPSINESMTEQQPNQSSTFTIESSDNLDSMLNDLEKENIIKEGNPSQPTAPSDDSFRALEQLLGLGSTPIASQQSPKVNHDTLSLTVVTPTDIINSTTTSMRRSYARKTRNDNLPSSQEIPAMTPIESTGSSDPPSFLIDNTMEQESIVNHENSLDKLNKEDDDEGNFSFELNDFSGNSKAESTMNDPPPPIRAPTCAEVAFRAIVKSRTSRRGSQPIKAASPLAMPNKPRSSAPSSRFPRSSNRRVSATAASKNASTVQDQLEVNPEGLIHDDNNDLSEVGKEAGFPEEMEQQSEKSSLFTLNLSDMLTEEAEQDKSMQQVGSPQPKKSLRQMKSIRSKKSIQPQSSIQPEEVQQNKSMQQFESPLSTRGKTSMQPIASVQQETSMQLFQSPQQNQSIQAEKSFQSRSSSRIEKNVSLQEIQSPQQKQSIQPRKSTPAKSSMKPELDNQQNASLQAIESIKSRTPRRTNASTMQDVSMKPIESVDNATPKRSHASTAQEVSLKLIDSVKSRTPRRTKASTMQDVSMKPIESIDNRTPKRTKASMVQDVSMKPVESIDNGTPSRAQTSTIQDVSIKPIESVNKRTPRRTKASTTQDISMKPVESVDNRKSRNTKASIMSNLSMQPIQSVQERKSRGTKVSMKSNTSMQQYKSPRKTKSIQPKRSMKVANVSMQEFQSPKPKASMRRSKSLKQNQSLRQEEFSTPSKALMPLLSREYTYNTPKRSSSHPRRSTAKASALKRQKTLNNSTLNSSSMLNTDLLYKVETEQKALPIMKSQRTLEKSTNDNSMLKVLLTNPTEVEQSGLQETLASTTMESTLNRNSMRKGKRLSTNLTPRVSINPLHSSTPSSTKKHKSLQMVAIGEQEQVLTTVPQPIPIEQIDEQESMEECIQHETSIVRTVEAGVQTTPSLNTSARRQFHGIEQTTPVTQMKKSMTSMIVEEHHERQVTPVQTKVVVSLQRNVRFELTPETDARLTAKEKLEEALRGLKPDIVIEPIPMIPQPKIQAKKPVKVTRSKKLKKKRLASKPKPVEKKAKKVQPAKRRAASKESKKPMEVVKVVEEKKPAAAETKRTPQKRSTVEVTVEPANKRSKTLKPIEAPAPTKVETARAKTQKTAKKSTKPKAQSAATKVKKHETKPIETDRKSRSASRNQEKVVAEPVMETPKSEKASKAVKKTTVSKQVKEQPKSSIPASNSQLEVPEPSKEESKTKKNSKASNKKSASKAKSTEKDTEVQVVTSVPEQKQSEESSRSSSRNKRKAAPEPAIVERKTRSASNADKKNTSQSKTQRTSSTKALNVSKSSEQEIKIIAEIKGQESKPQPTSVSKSKKTNGKTKGKSVEIEAEPEVIETNIGSKKRRLASVEKSEEIKKTEKEEAKSVADVQFVELSQEERKKIEESTVAQLKSRLHKRKADVPKGGKKADLVALLIKIETDLLKEQKPVETIKVSTTSAKSTRRRNK